MEDIEVRTYPCDDCDRTGHCSECGGTGRLEDGPCYCDGGKCTVCDGAGSLPDFRYKGKPIPILVDLWPRMLLAGLSVIAAGLMIGSLARIAPDSAWNDTEALLLGTATGLMGVVLVVLALRSRKILKLMKKAEADFFKLHMSWR